MSHPCRTVVARTNADISETVPGHEEAPHLDTKEPP